METENVYLKPITLKNIMKFALPTIAMSLFMAFYTMVDGLFVSNLIGTNALSAINLSAPIISLVTAISTMLATGGSAVIMKKAAGSQRKFYIFNCRQHCCRHHNDTNRIPLHEHALFSNGCIRRCSSSHKRLLKPLSAIYNFNLINE